MKETVVKRIVTGISLAIGASLWMFVGAVYLTSTFGNKPQWSAYTFMAINTLLLLVAMYEILKLRKSLKWSIWIKIPIFVMVVVLLWMPLGDETFGPYVYNSQWFQFWVTLIVYLFFIGLISIFRFAFKNFNTSDLVFIIFWTFYLVFVFKGVNFLMLQTQGVRQLGWPTLSYIWIIVISSDVGAYVGGSLWGKGKKQLAPKISPNKTWVGTITGFVSSVVLSTILVTLLLELTNIDPLPIYEGPYGKAPVYIVYIGISAILSLVSQAGDLLFSYVKRNHEVKDFSNIFPGHGGLLDRLDSFSLVTLVTFVLTYFLLIGVY